MAASASAASPTTSTTPAPAAASSARTPARNIAWSSTSTTRTAPSGLALGHRFSSSWWRGGGAGHVQADLGALAGSRAYVRPAAVARHPVDDAAADAVPVRRDAVDVEAGAAVADEDVHRGVRGLGVDVGALGAGVLGDVDDRLAGGVHDRAQRVVERAVADGDDVDDDVVLRLDVGRHLLERAGERGRVGASRPRRATGAGRAPGSGRAGRRWWRRGRSSGSGRGSGAPSRGGARPCRRAPGCGPARRARR